MCQKQLQPLVWWRPTHVWNITYVTRAFSLGSSARAQVEQSQIDMHDGSNDANSLFSESRWYADTVRVNRLKPANIYLKCQNENLNNFEREMTSSVNIHPHQNWVAEANGDVISG